MTVPEVADRLRCSAWSVRSLAHSGALRASLVAGRWLFRPEDVEQYLETQANMAPLRRRRRRSL